MNLSLEIYSQLNTGDILEVTKSLYRKSNERYYEYELNTYKFNDYPLTDVKKENLISTDTVIVKVIDKYKHRSNTIAGRVVVTHINRYISYIDEEKNITGNELVDSVDYNNTNSGDLVYAVREYYKTPKGKEIYIYKLAGAGK